MPKFPQIFPFLFLIISSAAAEPIDLKLGAIIHLTGDIAAPSESFREGIETAISEINASQTKVSIKLTLEDGQNSPKMSFLAAQKLATVDRVDAVILESVVDVMSSGKLFERNKIPSICIWDSNPEIEDAGQYIFAIGPWTPSAGEVSAKFAWQKLGAKRAIVFSNVETWSESVRVYFEKEFTRLGGQIAQSIFINPQDTEFRAEISRAISLKPDVIYAPLVFNVPAFQSQLKALGNKAPIISSDIITDEYIREAPEAFEGIYQSVVPDPQSDKYLEFEAKYIKQFKKHPDHPWFAAVGYDAVKLFYQALIADSNETNYREKIKNDLYRIKDFKGASAVITINEKGSSPQNEVMFKIVGGKLVPLGDG